MSDEQTGPGRRRSVAYVMSRYPHLPETFIFREFDAVSRLGWEVSLFPLIRQDQSLVHPLAAAWEPAVQPLGGAAVLRANLRLLGRQPLLYLRTWGRVLVENARRPGFLARSVVVVPRAVLAAERVVAAGIDHVHAHYATHPALAAWVISRLTGVSYTVTVHAHDLFLPATMTGRKLRDASDVIAISEFNRNWILDRYGSDFADRVHVVHCGVDTSALAPRQPAVDSTDRPPGRGPMRIVSVGSLQEYKGQRHLVLACAQLRRQGRDFSCSIVGDGPERAALEQLIRAEGLTGVVHLVGAKAEQDVLELVGGADCYVQPSVVAASGQMEGIPVALMEAMALGIPVVATNLSGVPELVRPGDTGSLVPPADAEALAAALGDVLDDPARARAAAVRARELVDDEFNLVRNARRLSSVFENARHRRTGSPSLPGPSRPTTRQARPTGVLTSEENA